MYGPVCVGRIDGISSVRNVDRGGIGWIKQAAAPALLSRSDQRDGRADGRLFTSNTGGAAMTGACCAFDNAEVVVSSVFPAVGVAGEAGERGALEADAVSRVSVLAKPANAASTSSGSNAAAMSHEKRLRRDAARTSSVGSGR
jgi:hypothetical protein